MFSDLSQSLSDLVGGLHEYSEELPEISSWEVQPDKQAVEGSDDVSESFWSDLGIEDDSEESVQA